MDTGPRIHEPGRFDDVLRAARRGIREHRMREAEVRIVDRAGRPLGGLPVEIVQTRHAFPFGEQLWPLDAMIRQGQGGTDRARAWKARFTEVFNAATSLCYWTERPRNDASKTEDRQGEPRVENFAATVAWALAEGMTAKGHPLFWSIPKCVPEWVKRYDVPTQMKFAEVRVRNLVARFRGRVRIWDAVNEALWEAAPKNLERRQWPHLEAMDDIVEYIAPVLRWCREEDPDAIYLINDYGTELEDGPLVGNDGSPVTAASQRKRYGDLLRRLQDAGAAPNAVGLQSHTGWPNPREQWAVYDEIAAAGLPLHVTEFWADTRALKATGRYSDEDLERMQAQYVVDFLTCAFGHPAVEAFFFWEFMDRAIAWFDGFSSHEPKPLFTSVRDLIRKEWQTRETLRTDGDGAVRWRGFFGSYALRYETAPGLTVGLPFDLTKASGMPLTVTIDVAPRL
jgi:GH35 family endo-1,4-beta-xylanase